MIIDTNDFCQRPVVVFQWQLRTKWVLYHNFPFSTFLFVTSTLFNWANVGEKTKQNHVKNDFDQKKKAKNRRGAEYY